MKILIKIIKAVSYIFILTVITRQVNASDVILGSDNFDDNNDHGWTRQHESGPIDYSSKWVIKDGKYGLVINSRFTVENSFYGDNSWTDYQVTFDMLAKSGEDKNFIFRYQDRSSQNLYNRWYELHISGNQAHLSKIGYGDIAPAVTASINHGIIYNWKATLVGDHIVIEYKKYYESEYTKLFDVYDASDPIENGKIAIRIGTGANYFAEIYFDNIVVTDLRDHLDVPHLSQTDQRWADEIYDHAPTWTDPESGYIKNWGCALTSAAMVLNYYGHITDPKSLNQYLIYRDGYNSWGGLIWGYISQFARDNKNRPENTELPDLEFSYPEYSASQLQTDLTAGQPDIIELMTESNPGGRHFVVATGPLNNLSNLIIQDPIKSNPGSAILSQAYPLAQPMRLGRFIPSHTDLSSLWTFGNTNLVHFSLTPPSSAVNLIPQFFTDGSIKDELSDKISETYRTILLSKPETGTYRLNLDADILSPQPIEIVAFDSSANDFHNTFHIFTGPDLSREIFINYDSENSRNTQITISTSVPLIIKLVGYGYDQGLMSQTPHRHLLHMLKQIDEHLQKPNGKSAQALIRALVSQVEEYAADGSINLNLSRTINDELNRLSVIH